MRSMVRSTHAFPIHAVISLAGVAFATGACGSTDGESISQDEAKFCIACVPPPAPTVPPIVYVPPPPPPSVPNGFVFSRADRSVVAQRFVSPSLGAENVFFAPPDLGGLSFVCADDLFLTFQRSAYHASTKAEIHLFARDSASIVSDLVQLSDADIASGAWTRQTAIPSALPRVVAMPYPLNAQSSTTAAATLGFEPRMFWGTSPDLGTPNVANESSCDGSAHRGAIRSVAVYQDALCATTLPLDDLLAQVTTGLWDGFRTNGSLSNPAQQYTHAVSTLGRGEPSGPYDVRAGFLLAFHYGAQVLGIGSDVWGLYRYRFGLDDGVLAIDKTQRLRVDGSGGLGSTFVQKLEASLDGELPARVGSSARGQQMQTLPISRECAAVTECGSSADALAALVTPLSMAAAGIANPTNDQIMHVRCALGSAVACRAIGRSADLSRAWSCPDPTWANGVDPASGKVCRLVTRAKRLTAMSDELQLVWFDDAELDNPAFAIRVAGGSTAQQRMCTAAPRAVGAQGYYVRAVSSVGVGP